MFISRIASRIRQMEAERARENRREIVRALGLGQITKRDLMRWGVLSAGGAMVAKNGLSPFAKSAYASVPTGTPRSPVQGLKRFVHGLPPPYPVDRYRLAPVADPGGSRDRAFQFVNAGNRILPDLPARRSSYHSLYSELRERGEPATAYTNPVTGIGPIEGRPPVYQGRDFYGHQRWDEFEPKVGFLLSMGQVEPSQSMHPGLRELEANAMWSCGPRHSSDGHLIVSGPPANTTNPVSTPGYYGLRTGYCSPPLVKMRYGEAAIMRIHNDLPVERHLNRGFGRNELSMHFHNAHTAAESDGANNAFHFPGTFYDYHWSAILARHDASINGALADKMRIDPGFNLADPRAASIDDNGAPVRINGDFREIQSSMWFHDHRFFFTAENVQKGIYGLVNMYSAPDNGNEKAPNNPVSLRLPSGWDKAWGNQDYDINLSITNPALDRDEQLTYDIFDTDGYLGDLLCVNGAFSPFLSVAKRRYRFRILNASMARFLQLALVDQNNKPLPFVVIANDGNLLRKPILITSGIMDRLGNAERFDIVVDFKRLYAQGVRQAYLVNLLYHKDGRGPEGRVSIGRAMSGFAEDPAVGPFLQFRLEANADDFSTDLFTSEFLNPTSGRVLTQAIPPLKPVRERHFRFGRGSVSARDPLTNECTPDCGEAENFPWAIRVNGEEWHAFNATRVSAIVPAMGDVEHWTFENNSGGWDHPVHLHFEEGVTLGRTGHTMAATERGARKDVWRLGENGSVKVQLRFSEFTGAYVQHCHNTTHEDFSMIMRIQVVGYNNGQPQYDLSPTPLPTPAGVEWGASEALPEAHPDFPAGDE